MRVSGRVPLKLGDVLVLLVLLVLREVVFDLGLVELEVDADRFDLGALES